MNNLPNYDAQKTAIEDVTIKFLQNQFGLTGISVKVLLDQGILVIRAINVICPAEIQVSADSKSAALIHEAYTWQFDKSKSFLIDQVSKITRKKIISDQIGVNFESRDLLITLFLS